MVNQAGTNLRHIRERELSGRNCLRRPASFKVGDFVLVHDSGPPSWLRNCLQDPYFQPYRIIRIRVRCSLRLGAELLCAIIDGYYVVASIARHKYKQSWKFPTLWYGYGLSQATWERIFAFIQPDGSINPIFCSYLVENNEGQLLTRAETLSQRKKKSESPPGHARRISPPRLRRNAHRCVYFVRRQGTSAPGPCPLVFLLPNYLLFFNLPRALRTLVQIGRPTECVPGQVQDSCRAPATMNVLTPTLNQVRRSRHLHIRRLRSTAPALAVPCKPMPMVTSVSQMAAYQVCSHRARECLVDRVLHGICPDVMTLGTKRRALAYYSRGE